MTSEPDQRLDDAGGSPGVAHLRELASVPRAAGSVEEGAARDYCADVLRELGFEVAIERFEYSAFPGRYGTPIAGAIATTLVLVTFWLATVEGSPRAAATAFGAGLAVLALFVWSMLGDAVLELPWLRVAGENLIARRGDAPPRAWLMAHVDSKSQPVPTRVRMAGIALLATSIVLSAVTLVLTLATDSPRIILWMVCAALAAVGGRAVVVSVVRNDSLGALDNASGLAAVLTAAASLHPAAPVGVLIPTAEELGLAGARAWVRAHGEERAFVLNCDGVDDHGELTLMHTRTRPTAIADAVQGAAGAVRVRRMPPGLLLDSVAFTDAGWSSATLSHGSLQSLARVHTRRDSLDAMSGTRIDAVASVLARAAEALAR